MLSPKTIGTITEYECATYLMKLGLTVSTPIGDNAKYDLVVEINKKLYKLQCKHGAYQNGGLMIECTTNINTRTRLEKYTYQKDDVDYFCTFYNGMCYLIPFERCKTVFKLRFESPGNNSRKGIHWADEYEAPNVIKSIVDLSS